MPSVLVSTCGLGALPRAASAHGQIAPGFSPNHSLVPTGTTPSASRASCSTRPTVTIRFGSALMVVVPNLLSIETGNAAAAGAELPPPAAGVSLSLFGPHAARTRRRPAAATVVIRRGVGSRTAFPFCQRGPGDGDLDGSVG